jgi:hypothetical protein
MFCEGPLIDGNAMRTNCRVPNAAGTPSAQRIRLIRGYRNVFVVFVKNRRDKYAIHLCNDVSGAVRPCGNGIPESSQMPELGPNLPDLS